MLGNRLRALACALFVVAGCKKDDAPQPTIPSAAQRVYVLCEGQYGTPTAALSVYLPEKDSVYADAFGSANAPQWGDVAQSLMLTADEIFICVNNSDRILVADRTTFKLKKTISVRKPRYIQPINDSVAMVSSLYSNALFRISLNSYTVTDSIRLPRKNSEGLLFQNDRLYVCPWDVAGDKVYVVEDGRHVVDSIAVGASPHTMALDKNEKAWILSGDAYQGVAAKFTRVNLATRAVEKTYAFPAGADPIRLAFNSTRDTLYYIGVNYTGGTSYNGVYRMAISADALPTTPFVAAAVNQYFWSVGIDPRTGLVYIGDPKGFTQKGRVMQYSPQGTLLKEISVGIGPNQFHFD